MSTLAALRRPLTLLVLLAALVGAVLARPAHAQDGASDDAGLVVDVLPVRGYLDPPVANAMRDLIEAANADGTALVVLQVDGPGGISIDVGGLLDTVRDSAVPVVVYVSPQQGIAARAGGGLGLLWLAGHVRAIADVGSVGPLAPADLGKAVGAFPEAERAADLLGGDGAPGALDALLASELPAVDPRDGEVEDLEDLDLVDVLAPNVASLLAELDGRTVVTGAGEVTLDLPREQIEVRLHSLGLLRRLLHAATVPAFIYLLLVVGLGMLLFELFQPGFGVAGFAGLIVLPFGLFGLTVLPVTWWALVLVLVGLALFSIDAAIAGLGPVTAAATASFGIGSWFVFGSGPLRVPPGVAISTTVAAVVFFVIVLTVIMRAQSGPEGVALEDLVGRLGIVRSILNPEGHVYIDDALWRAATAQEERLRVGTAVKVVGVEGAVLVVEPHES